MDPRFVCTSEQRRRLVERHPTLNGIDYLEVVDSRAEALGLQRQTTLWVRFFKALPGAPHALTADNVSIQGGVRLKDVGVVWAYRMDQVPSGLLTPPEAEEYAGREDREQWLVVRTDSSGDFSKYTLALRNSVAETAPPPGFDARVSRVELAFKVECPSEFDCAPPEVGAAPQAASPPIDYLTRDYASFRRLLLDRLSEVSPQWKERNAADLGVALVEVMAYTADYLSYYQDAVATEAYLGTARQRTSVRRHARMVDYPMHDGANARAWVSVSVSVGAEGWTLPGPTDTSPGTAFVTASQGGAVLEERELQEAVNAGAEVFESLHPLTLYEAHGCMTFHTWGEARCCLPVGATSATLRNDGARLQPDTFKAGLVLLLEEDRGPESGRTLDADPSRRHAVRLTRVTFGEDPLVEDALRGGPLPVVDIEWSGGDALPFELCLGEVEVTPGRPAPISVARGNVVLVDHGRTLDDALPQVPAEGRYRPRLPRGPLTQAARVAWKVVDPATPASEAFRGSMEDLLPAVRLSEDGRVWMPRRTLLNSGRFSREFVAEVEDDGRARLRFGDNVMGVRPAAGSRLRAIYRIGNGTAGNVGAGAIAHMYSPVQGDWRKGILRVRNPLPARGGLEPESLERVRIDAPQAFRTQQRAVTEADYAEVAQIHPEVQRAVGSLRWTGSWYTLFITVDRRGGFPVDEPFAERLGAFLERFRLAGYDLRLEGPVFVPLDIAMTVCVAPGYLASNVKSALLEVFSSKDLPDGRRGFFHPDNFTFGQPVYLSRIVSAAMGVPGVAWVDTDESEGKPHRFRRWGQPSRGERDAGLIELDRLEIARLDNDPSQPENGKLDFIMRGGL